MLTLPPNTNKFSTDTSYKYWKPQIVLFLFLFFLAHFLHNPLASFVATK